MVTDRHTVCAFVTPLANIAIISPFILTKCRHFIMGPVSKDLYISTVQIPTFHYLSLLHDSGGFTLIGAACMYVHCNITS